MRLPLFRVLAGNMVAVRMYCGVGFFISNNLNYKIRSDLNTNKDGIIETLFIEINSTSSKNIINRPTRITIGSITLEPSVS